VVGKGWQRKHGSPEIREAEFVGVVLLLGEDCVDGLALEPSQFTVGNGGADGAGDGDHGGNSG
jgi:hypothetical protein